MGISSALYSGVSGLNTNGQALSVIGNNLANTNTLGFKGSRTVFSDLLSASVMGSGGSSQVGRGVGMSRVDGIFSQGTFETTESSLDVAIEGDGFFILSPATDDRMFYTRAGAFNFNEQGFLVSPEGYRVIGQPFNSDGNLVPGAPTDIQVQNLGLIAGEPTTEMTFTTNLDAAIEVPATVPIFDYTDTSTYDFSSSSQVYDTLGNPKLITTYYTKTSTNTWDVNWSATLEDGSTVTGPATPLELAFTSNGVLADPSDPTIPATLPVTMSIGASELDWGNGSAPQDITVTFDTTQFYSDSGVISQEQNGFAAGELTGVDIDDSGAVTASYSNGKTVAIANLSLAAFRNPNGLEAVGSNLFTATATSGVPRVGLPGPELGKIYTNTLERSNVDMGAEFVSMINFQRGFQANSKIITTVDDLLNELINLKR
ncbi:MAG: flagellar hook protein FlgE [Desulfopila sp.]